MSLSKMPLSEEHNCSLPCFPQNILALDFLFSAISSVLSGFVRDDRLTRIRLLVKNITVFCNFHLFVVHVKYVNHTREICESLSFISRRHFSFVITVKSERRHVIMSPHYNKAVATQCCYMHMGLLCAYGLWSRMEFYPAWGQSS
ncbi:hypothetical protein HNQ74_000333 [Bartonella doshiae]|uniref:Uncharacterized protein n=2 Tax=Bartonella doshiae TaxID=33044 RepID=A0A380ZG51_BARDO|nr:hypothetical protein MCS_01266 [Bartonella doshiae NCTC 12862 = ATCC 700133]MBB6158927.1 hypothetical protein [Bartonella doshiae]SUV45540.1 Uncharacterised protein [Bartonella doshiae]